MFRIKHRGDFKNTEGLLERASDGKYLISLDSFGARGVAALSQATPTLTGQTASSWDYYVTRSRGSIKIVWTNSEMAGSAPLAILLQYGHGTRNGGYVQGQDFINPGMRAVFEEIANDIWAELTK